MSNQYLKLRRSSVPGKIPTTSSLEFGEIALNTYDGLAFMKKSGSNGEEIVIIGSTSGSFTGSLYGTASWAVNAVTASYFSGSISNAIFAETASLALTSSYSLNINGEQYRIAVFDTSNSISSSTIYQSASFTAIRATAPTDALNPDILFLDGTGIESYNLLSAHTDINSYSQINVQNFSAGNTSSADIVATNNVGDEESYYINMGINGDGYNVVDGIGQQNDAYLFSTGEDLLIGNASEGKRVIIFNGTGSAFSVARVFIVPEGTVGINSTDPNPTNPESLLVEPIAGASNPSQFSNLIVGKGTVHENYLQLNMINLGTGSLASADVVATNDIGTEIDYYIDMGINSSGYNTPNAVGMANDAYLYSTGEHLHIGNASDGMPVMFFAGGFDSEANRKLELWPDNQHQMSGSLNITGSLTVLEGITGSLYGTASWAENVLTASYVENAVSASYSFTASYVELAQSASYVEQAISASFATTASYVENAQTASYVLNAVSASFATNAATASSADDFIVRGALTGSDALFTGTITAQRLNVQYITASTEYITGSTIFGSQLTDTHQFTGSVSITGSLTVNGALNATSSWAQNAVTASYVQTAQTASYVLQAVSSSFATTASFVTLAQTASYVLQAVSASFATNALTASYVLNSVSSSFASTASFVTLAQTASFVTLAQTASFVTLAQTASFVATASWARNSVTSSFVTASNVYGPFGSNSVISSSYALTASFALNAGGGGSSFPFTGSAIISGSLQVTGSVSSTGGFTGSLLGTASWAQNVVSASYAATASSADNFLVRNVLTVESASIDYQQNLSLQTGSWQTIVAAATGSYRAAFFDYAMFSGSMGRAGTVTTFWSASATEFYENYTEDLGGSTVGVVLQTAISSSQIVLQATASSAAWTIRSLVRLL